ncbi:MAG: hypothetical protein ACI8RZ_004070 [Myxococcota bacterium]|jgi:hypothetical protein
MGPVFFCLLSVLACQDPPDPPITPPPTDLPRYATAPHVQWAGLAPTERILVVFVDEPGGPLDRIAANADVATFLNDRFSPVFLPPQIAPDLPRSILFVDPDGCLRLDPLHPESPQDFIDAGNKVMLGSPPQPYHSKPGQWGVQIPADHALQLRCSGE